MCRNPNNIRLELLFIGFISAVLGGDEIFRNFLSGKRQARPGGAQAKGEIESNQMNY